MATAPEFAVEMQIGERIVDMTNRLVKMDKMVPGAITTCTFDLDGIKYEVSLRVKRR